MVNDVKVLLCPCLWSWTTGLIGPLDPSSAESPHSFESRVLAWAAEQATILLALEGFPMLCNGIGRLNGDAICMPNPLLAILSSYNPYGSIELAIVLYKPWLFS